MKNITLSADPLLIEQARKVARSRNTSLNTLFREWLSGLVDQKEGEKKLKDLHQRLQYARSGGSFSREEMNER
jgi:hypothetical protein